MIRPTWLLAAAVLLAAAPAAARAQSPTAANVSAASDIGVLLRPGDVIRLRIWREPDLSGDFAVDENGAVVFPKIGRYTISNVSSDSLKSRLLNDYQVYLRNPSIDITLLRRVNILGAVRTPGLYPVDPTMTVADALALAGGTTPQGDPDKVGLIRSGSQLTANLSQRTRLADSPLRSGDQIFVPERRWVSRNSGVVAASITASVSLLIALLR